MVKQWIDEKCLYQRKHGNNFYIFQYKSGVFFFPPALSWSPEKIQVFVTQNYSSATKCLSLKNISDSFMEKQQQQQQQLMNNKAVRGWNDGAVNKQTCFASLRT